MSTPSGSSSSTTSDRRTPPPPASPARPGAIPPQAEHEGERGDADRERRDVRVARASPSRSQSCSKKSPSPLSTPNSFGSWPTMIVSARPTMKPLSTGSEMKFGEEAEPQQPGHERDDAGDDRQRRGQRHVRRLPLGGELRHGGGRQRRGGRHRPHDQVPRAAEQRVQHAARAARRRGRRPARRRRSTRRRATPARAPPTPSARPRGRRGPTPAGSPAATGTSRATMAGRRVRCRHPVRVIRHHPRDSYSGRR